MAVWTEVLYSHLSDEHRSDAEFFKPEYIKLDAELDRISEIERLGTLSLFVKKGIFDISPTRYTTNGVPLIRTFQIKTPIANHQNLVFLSEKDHSKAFFKTELFPGDIVLTKIGAGIGDVALLPNNFTTYNFSQNVAGVSINRSKINPYYLLAFLISHAGRQQIIRYMMPSGQGKLELRDIKKIKVLRFKNHEDSIASLVQQAELLIHKSSTLYNQAQHLLESELGVDKLEFKKPVGYTTRFSELEHSRRTDAEFFHTKYDPFISAVKDYQGGWSTLNLVTTRLLPNFNGQGRAEYYDYIEIGDINISNGEYISSRLPALQLPANAKILLSGGEILISQVRPTRGAIAIVEDYLPHPTVCSGAFYVCTAKDPSQREAIWLYLRIIRSVFEKYCGGTSYPTIESDYISKFPVPIFKKKFARKIQDLVLQSKDANRASIELLSQAKARVEQLIEEAAAQ